MNRSSFLKSAITIAAAPAILLEHANASVPNDKSILIQGEHINWKTLSKMMESVNENHPGYIFKGCAIHNWGNLDVQESHDDIIIKKSIFDFVCWIELPIVAGEIHIKTYDTVFDNSAIITNKITTGHWHGNNSTKFINCRMVSDNNPLYPQFWGRIAIPEPRASSMTIISNV